MPQKFENLLFDTSDILKTLGELFRKANENPKELDTNKLNKIMKNVFTSDYSWLKDSPYAKRSVIFEILDRIGKEDKDIDITMIKLQITLIGRQIGIDI